LGSLIRFSTNRYIQLKAHSLSHASDLPAVFWRQYVGENEGTRDIWHCYSLYFSRAAGEVKLMDVGIDREIIVVLRLPLCCFFVLDETECALIKLYRVLCFNSLLGCWLPFPSVRDLASSCFVLDQAKVLEFFCASQDQIKEPDFLRLWLESIDIDISHPSLDCPKLHLLLALFEVSEELK